MTHFPDEYKRLLLDRADDMVEIARVLVQRHPDLTLSECCQIVHISNVDASFAMFYNSLTFTASAPVRKIK